ncbi:MAG: hypothetical protein ING32_15255 [Curvibacter sp.]|jgi:hypothetical protein|nr:hypothetical protein [Curvibacter sp.]
MEVSAQDESAEFESAVLDSFKFLESEHGFSRRSSRPQKYTQLVVYENPELYVVLSYGPPAFEPEMSFGRRGIDDMPGAYSFHSGDLVQLDCCRSWTWNKDRGHPLACWVAELARLFALCGEHCLTGDPVIFTQMKTRRDKLVADWKHEERLKGVRTQIDSAWKAKDYKNVLHLYKSIDDLTDLDKKRIVFATTRST